MKHPGTDFMECYAIFKLGLSILCVLLFALIRYNTKTTFGLFHIGAPLTGLKLVEMSFTKVHTSVLQSWSGNIWIRNSWQLWGGCLFCQAYFVIWNQTCDGEILTFWNQVFRGLRVLCLCIVFYWCILAKKCVIIQISTILQKKQTNCHLVKTPGPDGL